MYSPLSYPQAQPSYSGAQGNGFKRRLRVRDEQVNRRGISPSAKDPDDFLREMDELNVTDDIPGLKRYLQSLSLNGIKFTDAWYIVNQWRAAKVVPLQHHGVVLRATNGHFLSLDMMRKGLQWNLGETQSDNSFPFELPRKTEMFVQYRLLTGDPALILQYVNETEDFSWTSNNCVSWTEGLFEDMGVQKVGGGFDPSKLTSNAPTPAAAPALNSYYHHTQPQTGAYWQLPLRQVSSYSAGLPAQSTSAYPPIHSNDNNRHSPVYTNVSQACRWNRSHVPNTTNSGSYISSARPPTSYVPRLQSPSYVPNITSSGSYIASAGPPSSYVPRMQSPSYVPIYSSASSYTSRYYTY